MDPKESTRIIEAAGGPRALAALLGFDDAPGYRQRVHNWKTRGIPPRVILDNLALIQLLQQKVERRR